MNRKLHHPKYAVAALVMLLAIVFAPRPANAGVWYSTLFEWLHVPVFGLVSLALLALTPPAWQRRQRFVLAFVCTLVLGIFTEAIQIPMRRDASWDDIIADALGATSFLLFAATVQQKRVTAYTSIFAGTAILVWTLIPLGAVTAAVYQRNARFPVIFNGDIESERMFVSGINTRMESQKLKPDGGTYTSVEFATQSAPRIEIRDLVPDWSGYSKLNVKVGVPGNQELTLTVRIHDKAHRRGDQPHEDRFSRQYIIAPGLNTVAVPLDEIKSAPRDRLMDMAQIEALILFSDNENGLRGMNLYEIRLN